MIIGFIIGFIVSAILFVAIGISERNSLLEELNEERKNNNNLQILYMQLQNEVHGIVIKALEDGKVISILDYEGEEHEINKAE